MWYDRRRCRGGRRRVAAGVAGGVTGEALYGAAGGGKFGGPDDGGRGEGSGAEWRRADARAVCANGDELVRKSSEPRVVTDPGERRGRGGTGAGVTTAARGGVVV